MGLKSMDQIYSITNQNLRSWWEFKLHRITCWQLSMHLTAKFNLLPWFVLWEAISALLWYPIICFPVRDGPRMSDQWALPFNPQNSVQSGVCECVCLESSQREERMLYQKMQTPLSLSIYIYTNKYIYTIYILHITHFSWTTWLNGSVKWIRVSP